ncbi:MAG: DUF2834 domain-containing protein [Gammaproteobacteria bacterium]|nr:DUF2834 domain-containing protein [Gammaproteobacteria bacterium]MCY4358891.1 DUF2834 domain-containing protein [Gammaproteobacteria bacterium]
MKTVYLILACIGAVMPWWFFFEFFSSNGADAPLFIGSLLANGAVGGFTADLVISSVAFWLFMFSRSDHGPAPWIFIVLNLGIGLSFALPSYLWANEKYRLTNAN